MTATDKQLSIGQVIDIEYKPYSMYVLENRAIPSCIDGFKPTHRKLVYAMVNEFKGKKTKVADLGSISKYNYHHGEASAMGAAITLAASWNNNVPVFNAHGNFGSRLITDAAAPRYIFASLGEDFYKYFGDFEVCDSHSDQDNPEPQTYLPYIPWVLVNGIEGIAVGFACKFAPHDPKKLAKACIQAVQGKRVDPALLIPFWSSFKGKVESEVPGDYSKVKLTGIIERTKRNTWLISEVPFGVDRETYFNHLSKMEDEGKIEDFEDGCDDSGFRFTVKVNGVQDAKCSADPIGYFKLSKIYSENYTTLDETGKLRLFNDKVEIVKYFCDYRLKKVRQKIDYDIAVITKKIEFLKAKSSFIAAVIDGSIGDLRKMTKVQMEEFCLTKLAINEEFIGRIVSVPVYSMTADEYAKLQDNIAEITREHTRLTQLNEVDVYIDKLKELAK